MARDLPLRAWNKIRARTKRTPTCWLWTGSLDSSGYPYIHVGGKNHWIHQIAYEEAKGDRKGLNVLHQCDTPRCVNPDHLFLGTNQDNVDDMIRKGRKVTLKGEESNFTHLPQDVIDKVIVEKTSGKTQQIVADELGVSRAYVGLLWQGKRRNGT